VHRLLATLKRWTNDPDFHRRVALLAEVPLFAGLRRRVLGRIAIRLFEKSYAAGEVIFEEGEPGRALYLLEKGTVEVTRQTADGAAVLARFEAPAVFGELALVDDLPRSATARAAADCRLHLLYRTHFDELLEHEPRVAVALSRRLLVTFARYVRARGGTYARAAEPPATKP
jgi:CRP-like cAMP-binding protein